MFVPYATIKQQYKISRNTIKSWADKNVVKIVRLPGGKRLYCKENVEYLLTGASGRGSIIYARVSSSKQAQDLDRQVAMLQEAFPKYKVIKDIGSGLNYNRPGFKRLLEHVHRGEVEEVVVAYRDRLCRYGFELVEFLCTKAGTKIVVHSKGEAASDSEELAQDLLAVCNYFVAKNNGRRAAQNRKRKRKGTELQKDKDGSLN